MKSVFLGLIKFYQYLISPFLPMSCRFYPTCSQYTYGAIKHRGAIKGLSLALRRLLKCHPFHPGGYDPFPIGANKSTESK